MFLSGSDLELVHLNRYGYALMSDPRSFHLSLEGLSTYVDFEKSSMINLNRILFVFQVRIQKLYNPLLINFTSNLICCSIIERSRLDLFDNKRYAH